jgi:hypothetical protein
MLYTGRNENPRMGEAPRTEERRTFTRRIDCEDTRRARPSELLAAPPRDARGAPGRRAYDID